MNKIQFLPTTCIFIAIAVMFALYILFPVTVIISYPWKLLGILPLVLGLIVTVGADRSFKKAGTTVKPFEESSKLITDGFFRLSRNPMYLGFLLILLGLAFFFGALTPFAVVPVFGFIIDRIYIRTEEEMLSEKFGSEWSEYKQKTRKWL